MRAFIALPLPEEIKKEIGKIQDQLKRAGTKATWVRPEIVHLTLAFLGSIEPSKVEPIGKILKEVAAQIKPAEVFLHQVSCFPSPTRPRVIFIDLQGEIRKLNVLSAKIRQGLKKEKIWFDEKPFSAHITLGRIKKRHPKPRRVQGSPEPNSVLVHGQNLTSQIKAPKIKKKEFMLNEVILYQSTLSQAGSVYQPIKEVDLTP